MHGHHYLPAEVLEMFLEESRTSAFLRDWTGTYLWVNHAYAALYGLDEPKEMVGRDIFAFDPPMLAEVYLESDRQVLASGVALRHTVPLPRPDGLGLAVGRRFRVPLSDGRTGVGGVYTDATDVNRITDEVQSLVARNQALFERSPIPQAVLSTAGVIREVNAAFADLADRPAAGLVGQSIEAFLDGVGVWSIGQQTGNGSRAAPAMTTIRLRSGSAVPATVTATMEPDRDGVVVAVQPLPRGITGAGLPVLSRQETILLEMVALGWSNTLVATRMHMSRQGLDYHLRRLRDRLGAASRADLVARAYAMGVLNVGKWPPKVVRPQES